MRNKILKSLAGLHSNHPWKMLSFVLVFTVLFGIMAIKIKHTMRWSDLLPAKDKRTIQFNKVLDEFVSATSIVVVVQGEEEKIKAFAEAAVPQIAQQIDPKDGKLFFKRIDYKQETGFIKEHGLMLIKADDLKNMKDVFKNPNLLPLLTNINTSLEKEYIQREESISTREKEDSAFMFLDGIENFIKVIQKHLSGDSVPLKDVHQSADKLLTGEEYMLSYDKQALILNVIPNFTMVDINKVVTGTNTVQEIIDNLMKKFDGVQAGLTGMVPIQRDEMVYSEQSLGISTLIAFIAIYVLLVLAFRMWIAPLFALLNLLFGVICVVGLTAITVGTLNIMTSMMGVILIGLGIDFSIHIISSFTENRSLGLPIEDSLQETFLNSGKGIITGAITTAVAFFTLIICRSRGMKELGIVSGSGLLTIMVVTFLCLPALLVLREKRLEKKIKTGKLKKIVGPKDISLKILGKIGGLLSKKYRLTIIISLMVTGFLVFSALRITFDQNYMNMEPKGLDSVELQDVILEKFDLSIDYAMILADSVAESRELAKKIKELPSVASIEDISLYFPAEEEQKKRIPHILEIKKSLLASTLNQSFSLTKMDNLLKELERLEMNVMEMQDMAYLGGQDKIDNKCSKITGDPDQPKSINIIRKLINFLHQHKTAGIPKLETFQNSFSPYFKKTALRMCSEEIIRQKDLPVSILDRYSNKERTRFLVTAFPSMNIWQDLEFLDRFSDDLEKTSEKATGMPVIFRAVIDIVARDGRNALILTIFMVFILLWLDFRSPVDALIAMIPLIAGLFWMLGIMKVIGMQITMLNVMGLPMIVGIGIDDGVHIMHRWKIEGKNAIDKIFASTGKAIFITSLTTMLAFGSLMFSIWRGFASLGAAMFIGVGACFLTTVIILSAIMGLIDQKSAGKK
ncbi:MMPL family transporter [bacterium]|nr:MMPL family transporter [bacterium]